MDESDRGPACSSSAANTIRNLKIRNVNESVYELHRPTGTPRMQVLFFHGLHFGDLKDAHLSTWTSGHGSESHIWPQTWLVRKFPDAHVLSISYDARVVKGDGNFDLFTIGENLTTDLLGANIGQELHCPVILVGHCFGGLVIKQMCLQAHKRVGSSSWRSAKLKNFLQNVKAIFYYATPHRGMDLKNILSLPYFAQAGPLMQFVETLSTESARLNYDFDALVDGSYKNAWLIAGIGESLPTRVGRFLGLVVSEASARSGDNFNVAEETDHVSICKPRSETSRSFYALTDLLDYIASESKARLHELLPLASYTVKLDERAREIEEKLRDAQVLGIVGMGGIGKSTLAIKVFNNIFTEFEYTCFADNVKGQTHGLDDWFLRQFRHNGRSIEKQLTWHDLNDKKILIIMDDVDAEHVMELPKLRDLDNGSRVIITTRDQSVLEVYDSYVCHVHEIQFLEDDDATKLFCKHAFGQETLPDSQAGRSQLIRDVHEIIKKCDGLPLTLEVMGRYLRGSRNDPDYWQETIARLGKAQPLNGGRKDRLWAALRLSYDALIPEEQEMFASAATFFFEQPLEDALAAWSTTCGFPQTRWKNLVNRCLVKEAYKTNNNPFSEMESECKTVWVHEQLRDLAKTLPMGNMLDASNQKSAPKVLEILNAQRVEGETLCCGARICFELVGEIKQSLRTLRWRSLLNLKQLKYLELKGVILEGYPWKFPTRLSLLRFKDGTSSFPAINFIEEMENLAVLELGNLSTSWAFPVALGKLTNLRILRLTSIRTGWFTSKYPLPNDWSLLSRLKHLELAELTLTKLPESFGNLLFLEYLAFTNVKSMELPESFGSLVSLKYLVFKWVELTELPESFGNLFSLEKLVIHNVDLQTLPSNFGQLKALKMLTIAYTKLDSLPSSFGLLTSLQYLTIIRYNPPLDSMKVLPESVGQLSLLRELQFHSSSTETLPQSLGQLTSLVKLDLDVANVKVLPESVGQLSSLRELQFVSASVETLPESLGQLTSLERMMLNVQRVKVLPESVGQLSSLREFLFESGSAETLPQSLGQLTSLVKLHLNHSVNVLPESVGQLSSLRELQFCSLSTDTLPQSLGQLTSLEILNLGVLRVKALPESVGQLSSLRELQFHSRSAETLPQSLGQLTSLVTLYLKVPSGKVLPESVGQLSSLRELQFISQSAETLPQSIGQLTSLVNLNLQVPSVKVLPESVGQLSSLRELQFFSTSVETLPQSLGHLTSLKRIMLHVRRVKVLPESVGQLSSRCNCTFFLSELENANV